MRLVSVKSGTTHGSRAVLANLLDTLDSAQLATHTIKRIHPHTPYKESIGTRLRRTTYHYWYHTGESQAIRQLLGHTRLPSFVGDIGDKAPYIPEV